MINPQPGDILVDSDGDRILVLQTTEYWQASVTGFEEDGYYETVVWAGGEPQKVLSLHMMPIEPAFKMHWRPGRDGEKVVTITSPSTYPPLGYKLVRPE